MTLTFTGTLSRYNDTHTLHSNVKDSTRLQEKQHFTMLYKTLHNSASNWRDIGLFLELPRNQLDVIESDTEKVHSRLERMLSLWLRRVDPLPTKGKIIEVLTKLNLSKEAEELEKELT